MSKNASGTREMLFHEQAAKGGISKTRKNSIRPEVFNTSNSFQREVSLGSLRQNHRQMINVDSQASLTVRQMPSESRSFTQKFRNSPSATNLDF